MKKLTLGLTVAALALTGTAYAAPGNAPRDGEARRNAVMTRSDVEQRASRMFPRLDVNHDGRIDQTDRAERRAGRLAARFDRLDADHNGALSKAEFAATPAFADGRGERAGRRQHGRRMGRMANFERGGVITQGEFTDRLVQRFDRMDANRDGQVTRDERQSARAQLRAQRQDRRGSKRAVPPAAE